MKRRDFIHQSVGTAAVLGATGVFASKAHAQQAPVCGALGVAIGANHGHALALERDELIRILRRTHDNDSFEILNIQGASGHPHTIQVHFDEALQVLTQGQVEVQSSTDAGHTHSVRISLEV